LSRYDRIVITGTLPGACFAEGMTRILKAHGIRVFDYPTQFAAPLSDRVREAAAPHVPQLREENPAGAGPPTDKCIKTSTYDRCPILLRESSRETKDRSERASRDE
jgi:hypothetical protein